MTSTSTFKTTPERPTILEVEKLNLIYRIPMQRRTAWRDVFTSLMKEPIDTLFPQVEELQVARNTTFKILEGERVGLIGVNGAGKTSLCRCIAGMFEPTSGEIRRFAPVRGIFDTHLGIQPELTGRENAELLAHFLYPDHENFEDVLEEALEFSELEKFLDVPYKLYSNGMQARLCLSLITSQPAGLLILDEVFDGADMFFREKMGERVLNLMTRSGAVIFVSHSFEQIERVCSRVLIQSAGSIIFDGAPQEGLRFFKETNHAGISQPTL